jgi:MYXO-CTERM domain-containing protein
MDTTIGTCGSTGTGGAGTGGSGTGGHNDGYTASGNGLICAAQPGRSSDGNAWLLGGLAGLLLALRRRRR